MTKGGRSVLFPLLARDTGKAETGPANRKLGKLALSWSLIATCLSSRIAGLGLRCKPVKRWVAFRLVIIGGIGGTLTDYTSEMIKIVSLTLHL